MNQFLVIDRYNNATLIKSDTIDNAVIKVQNFYNQSLSPFKIYSISLVTETLKKAGI